jgi:hypothetical protein
LLIFAVVQKAGMQNMAKWKNHLFGTKSQGKLLARDILLRAKVLAEKAVKSHFFLPETIIKHRGH